MARLREHSLSIQASALQGSGFAALVALALMAASPVHAQTDPLPPGGTLPAGTALREGNIYDHQDHQPTAAEVGDTEPSPASAANENREVQDFLKQMDALDREAEEQDREGRQ